MSLAEMRHARAQPELSGSAHANGASHLLPASPALRMYEYNEHNKSLFSGAVGAAQYINIMTLFSGVRTIIHYLI